MCLHLNHLEPKIADKDIVCYKLVEKTKIKGVYKSCFQEFEYVIRQSYTNNLDIKFVDRIIKNLCPSYPHYGIYAIEEGMFHSYTNYMPFKLLFILPDESILKCIIPKGAYYYEGHFNYYTSYASSQIKILEEI